MIEFSVPLINYLQMKIKKKTLKFCIQKGSQLYLSFKCFMKTDFAAFVDNRWLRFFTVNEHDDDASKYRADLELSV